MRGRLGLLVIALGLFALAPGRLSAAPEVSPGLFDEVSTGVALIHTFTCNGTPIGQGSGFLVGTSVVMTARHVMIGACRAKIAVDADTFTVTHWSSWHGGGASASAADVATLKLDHPVSEDGYIFRVRSSLPPLGANVGAVGYPLGNRLSLNQGKLIRRWTINRAPVIAVRMLGAEGGSGSAFIDDEGRVVGILQIGLGGKDILGQRTSGVLLGLDLVRWWGPNARLDLCRAYPHGGIAGCTPPKPPPPPPTTTTTPPPPPPPTPPPAAPHVVACWAQYDAGGTSTWNPASATTTFSGADILARGAQNFAEIAQLNVAPTTDLTNVTLTLIAPNGTTFATAPFSDWRAGSTLGGFDFHWTFSDNSLFFQHPELTGTGTWTWRWTGPDGLTCTNTTTIS